MRPLTQVPNASRCVIYREGNSFGVEFYNNIDPEINPHSMGLKVDGWHGGPMEFTAAYADGHAGMISHHVRTNVTGGDRYGGSFTFGEYTVRGCRAEEVNIPEPLNFGGPVGATFAIVRGDGWQMDYFPAPLNNVITDPSEL